MNKWWYHENHVHFVKSSNSQKRLQVGTPSRLPLTPLIESIKAAQLINQSTDEVIKVFFSGGLDSEAVVLAFLKAGVRFTTVLVEFSDQLNRFDLKAAYDFCKRHKIKPEVVSFCCKSFFASSEYQNLMKSYKCLYPILAAQIHWALQSRGFVVYAGNPAVTVNRFGDLIWYFPDQIFMCLDEALADHDRGGVGHFFLYTPELIHSFALLPSVKSGRFAQLHEPKKEKPEIDHLIKHAIYSEGGFEMEFRKKYCGFENFEVAYRRGFGIPWLEREVRNAAEMEGLNQEFPVSRYFHSPGTEYIS